MQCCEGLGKQALQTDRPEDTTIYGAVPSRAQSQGQDDRGGRGSTVRPFYSDKHLNILGCNFDFLFRSTSAP